MVTEFLEGNQLAVAHLVFHRRHRVVRSVRALGAYDSHAFADGFSVVGPALEVSDEGENAAQRAGSHHRGWGGAAAGGIQAGWSPGRSRSGLANKGAGGVANSLRRRRHGCQLARTAGPENSTLATGAPDRSDSPPCPKLPAPPARQ